MKKLPDTLVIASAILLLFIGLTWLISAGEYSRELVNGRNVLVPGSYQEVTPSPQGITSFFTAPLKGFISAAEIIAFIFIVGGAFGMMTTTGAIESGLQRLVAWSNKHALYKKIIIPVIIVFFSIAGATFGMSEEVLIFILITLPMSKAMKLDPIVGVAIPFVGAGIGFAGAISNPFTIGIAQAIAEVPLFSGWEYRIFVWVVFTTIGVVYIMRYVSKIANDSSKSLMADSIEQNNDLADADIIPFTLRRSLVLFTFASGIVMLVIGVAKYDWYMIEIGGLFFAIGIISCIICGIHVDKMSAGFVKGAKEMMTAALVVAFCKGILIVASDGKIIDTVLHGIAGMVSGLPKVASIEAMFIFQSALNTFLPSGSGQAALTMPIMAPLSDLLGISRQVAVLAFQFGDGLTNLIIPTSGVTMGVLSIAKIPYETWVKWMGPLLVILMVAAGILLLIPMYSGLW
ncbi:YfcC family protein [Flammeovirga kamogawensis]|uniref:TIGR00366 family protein n=1 Tax=Flammeovirga kamogawensis TaxID=373891 RepID=A0ABX8GZI3_9BACT|nr:TIGR00366 family protein [Flammeovirga kamogawensis]MBB6459019.1 putative ion transporter superfamily protein YfcC [Flammeovirga kamogawensis]QWG08592.1 TIGR00366 family protein [Flammeovirga kamogawensis]TRX66884.1 putative basic amino acid antiporter YfcC [Flammeovirga kamogawensis]